MTTKRPATRDDIKPGARLIWEPFIPTACSVIRVLQIRDDIPGEEPIVETFAEIPDRYQIGRPAEYRTCWNEMGRVLEACWIVEGNQDV